MKMQYKQLGRTGLQASVIGLGGEWLNKKSQKEVTAVFDAAIENGINFLDVFMPQPETRSCIGNALVGRREKMIIQGHICTAMENGNYERTRDINTTKKSFEDLLIRLQTDYIDIGMIHYVDSQEDFDKVFGTEILEYAKSLKSKGVIKHIGLSSHNPLIALKAIETGLIDVLMFSINAAYDLESADTDVFSLVEFKGLGTENWTMDPARSKLYATCERAGVAITVMKALGAGSLLKAETSPFGKAMTVTQCCHYCLTRPAVASVLVGFSTADEVHSALTYLSATDEEKDYTHILKGSGQIKMTGKCMYCNHCQPCPSQIDIAAVTKYLDLATIQNEVPPTVRQHYHSMAVTAEDCTMCGNCEPRCPFGVKVRDNMEKAREIFG